MNDKQNLETCFRTGDVASPLVGSLEALELWAEKTAGCLLFRVTVTSQALSPFSTSLGAEEESGGQDGAAGSGVAAVLTQSQTLLITTTLLWPQVAASDLRGALPFARACAPLVTADRPSCLREGTAG